MIRKAKKHDIDALCRAVREAFDRQQEADFMARLWRDDDLVILLVAEEDGDIVGTVAFSRASLRRNHRIVNVAWLSPLAVVPGHQRRGLGSGLVTEGLAQCRRLGFDHVVCLGDVPYYARFGFSSEAAARLTSRWRGEALMALTFDPARLSELEGELMEPASFQMLSASHAT